MVSVTSPRGYTTTFAYDAAGNRVRATGPRGVTTWTYDPDNRPTGVVDPTGNASANPAEYRTVSEYTPAGQVSRVTDPYGRGY